MSLIEDESALAADSFTGRTWIRRPRRDPCGALIEHRGDLRWSRKQTEGESMLVIDRFEGDQAVIEHDGHTFTLPRSLLPKEAKEGDVLRIGIEIDRTATDDRQKRVKSLEDRLFKK